MMKTERTSRDNEIGICELKAEDQARWDAFVETCPQATFFHRAGWQRVIEEAFGHRTWFLYAERDGEIEGVLPLAQINSRLFGNSLTSLPFCVYGGVAANSVEAMQRLTEAAQHKGLGKALLREAERIAAGEFGAKRMTILSGVGAREYYRTEFGYQSQGDYMVRELGKA